MTFTSPLRARGDSGPEAAPARGPRGAAWRVGGGGEEPPVHSTLVDLGTRERRSPISIFRVYA